jgi:hypothetical protein
MSHIEMSALVLIFAILGTIAVLLGDDDDPRFP